MCQRHASVVTAENVWTTILPSFQKTDDEIRRLCECNIHLLFVCRDTYAVLKPVFWTEMWDVNWRGKPSHTNTSEPLGDTTDTQLEKDQNDQNIVEVKQETDNPLVIEASNVQDQLGLVNVLALPNTDHVLPDATTNLLVDLPSVDETPMDTTMGVPTVDEEGQQNLVKLWMMMNLLYHHKIKPPQNLATSVPCSIVLKD